MQKQLCKYIFKLAGWKPTIKAVPDKKCILVGVPHTSSWDFVISWIFYTSLGGKANILIKKEFFFWPLGYFLKKMGGIPVDRSKGANALRQVIKLFKEREHLQLAITPEGTRKRTVRWRAGFHTIARKANVPVYPATFDWGRKEMTIWEKFELTDDHEHDIRRLKDFFRDKGVRGRNPDQFSTDY